MAKKRPKVSTVGSGGGISREEAMSIGKQVTVPTPVPVKKKAVEKTAAKPVPKAKPISKPIPVASDEDPMVIVRIRKSFKQRAKSRASALDMKLYEYLELLVEKDIEQ